MIDLGMLVCSLVNTLQSSGKSDGVAVTIITKKRKGLGFMGAIRAFCQLVQLAALAAPA